MLEATGTASAYTAGTTRTHATGTASAYTAGTTRTHATGATSAYTASTQPLSWDHRGPYCGYSSGQ